MTRAQQGHRARATRDGAGAGAKRRRRPDQSGQHARAESQPLRDALVRWLLERIARASRWLRRRLRFSRGAILDAFKRWTKDRGFGFWWLVAMLLLAGIVGLIVAALLTPVMGLLACLGVGIWMLFRKRPDDTREKSGEQRARKRRADRDKVRSPAAA